MTGQDRKQLRRFTRTVCELLEIEAPRIREAARLETETTLAASASDGSEILFRSDLTLSPDLYFAVAHELRHIWQLRTAPERWMQDYRRSAETDLVSYNMQPAELDANAYAALVMINLYGIKPLFNGLPNQVITAIYCRAAEIAQKED